MSRLRTGQALAIKEQTWLKGSVEKIWGHMGFRFTAERRHELEN